MNDHIIITESQASTIRGNYGNYSAIDPILIPDGSYIVPEMCLNDVDLADAKVLIESANGDVKSIIDLPDSGWIESGNLYRYAIGDFSVIKCVQSHERTIYPPEETPALFVVSYSDFDEWVQPTGAHDAYAIGAKVTHNGSKWESTVDNNVWEPGVYGWIEI